MDPRRVRSGDGGLGGEGSIVRVVDASLADAARAGASDVHLEPLADALRVRIRVDGCLRELRRFPAAMAAAIASRVKVMARMDIAERRLPQDGRLELRDGRGGAVDARVSALPTVYGEKLVLRLLPKTDDVAELDRLGMAGAQAAIVRRHLARAAGMMLVTGPTGSGKTTTLYALLRELDTVGLNIVAVEDPVERRLPGVNQVQVNDDIGLGFATTLRALLRQDPDVIMLGEIRDQTTAEIAFRAALTGHLVLSTLHTDDAAASVTRLVDMGIAPYLVAAALRLVVAQRLLRTRCADCGASAPAGCEACGGSGLRGRVGLFEVLEVDDEVRRHIGGSAGAEEIRRAAVAAGMQTLAAAAQGLVRQGRTTAAEAWRIAGDDSEGQGGSLNESDWS